MDPTLKSYNAALASKSVELKKKSDAAYKKAAEKEATAYKNWKKKHPNEDDDNFGDWLTTKSGSKVDYGRAEFNTAYKLYRDAALGYQNASIIRAETAAKYGYKRN